MTDQVVEDVVVEDQQDDSAFESGFNQAMGTEEPTTGPTEEEPPAVVEEPAPEAPKEEEVVPLTKSEVQQLIGRLDELDKLKTSQDRAFGHIGSLKETIDKLRTAQTTGEAAEITDEDMKDIAAEYPEFGAALKQTLQKISGKFRGGSAPAAKEFDPNPIREEFSNQLSERDRKYEAKLLSAYHRDWKTVTNSDGFRVWLGTQPEEFRTQISNSWDAEDISGAIDQFKSYEAAKPNAVAKQKKTNRLEAAVTPTGVKAPDTSALNEEDAFLSGFKSVRGR